MIGSVCIALIFVLFPARLASGHGRSNDHFDPKQKCTTLACRFLK